MAVGRAAVGSGVFKATVAAEDWDAGGVQVGGNVGTGSLCEKVLLSSRISWIWLAASTNTIFSPSGTYPANQIMTV